MQALDEYLKMALQIAKRQELLELLRFLEIKDFTTYDSF